VLSVAVINIPTCINLFSFKNKAVGFCQRPRPLQHKRYTRTSAFSRWGMAVTAVHITVQYKFVTVSLLKQPHGGFSLRIKTPTWIQK
jgi:hypothetical protein